MTQSRPEITTYTPPFQPNQEQLARKAALHRFNRLYVYFPLGFIIAASLTIIILFLVGVFAPGLTGAAEFASALADITIILFSIPMMVLCAVGPIMLAGIIALSRNRRQQGIPRMDDGGRIQELLWKMDNLIQRSQTKTSEIAPKITKPVIEANAKLAYIKAFIKQIRSYLKRS